VVGFTPRPLYHRKILPGSHWTGGCMGSRAGLDAVVKIKNSCPCREPNLSRLACSLVTMLTELSQLIKRSRTERGRQIRPLQWLTTGLTTGFRLPTEERIFLFSITSRSAVGSTQPMGTRGKAAEA
jgi:hypothetical protein